MNTPGEGPASGPEGEKPELNEVEIAVENRILADALRQLEEVEPDESDDWRVNPPFNYPDVEGDGEGGMGADREV